MNETPNTTPVSPRRVPFWLVISLMANMALVGLVAGLLLRTGPSQVSPGSRPPERFVWASRDDGSRNAIEMVFREAFQASDAERKARDESRKALAIAVTSEPYDAEAVRKAFASLREADDSVNQATHEAMVDLFATLPLEDRKHMARILTHGPGDRGRMRRLRPDDRGMPGGGPDSRMDGPPRPDMEP
jgi:uncharacterized membrane protein